MMNKLYVEIKRKAKQGRPKYYPGLITIVLTNNRVTHPRKKAF